jgi:hypothetical protein
VITAENTPEGSFRSLKEAHVRLTKAYNDAHDASGFLTRPVVDDHLRRRLKQLRDVYIQAAESTFHAPTERRWLHEESDRMEKLASTFSRRWRPFKFATGVRSAVGFFAPLGLFLGATGFSAAALAIFQRCLCHVMAFGPLLASVAIGLALPNAFHDKRKMFIEALPLKGGIYGAEDAIFQALGEAKPRERPVDLIGWLWIAGIWFVAAVTGSIAIERGLFQHQHHWVLYAFAAAAALAAVYAFVDWFRRKPQ